ncbi:MAG TPA: hypothetical protein PLJ60_20325, partial [Chryseolinea sp.]|nr:hypothetical protein [Chryseolinea sp.]
YIDVEENKVDIRRAILYTSTGSMVTEATWVKEEGGKKGIVEMNNLPTGVYIMRLFTSERIVNLKIYKK